jgi:hypothetical protein
MPDELSEREVADLFAGLRADVMPLVRAPGVAAARRTVRRRRAATTAALVVTLLAALGLGTVLRPAVFDGQPADGPLSDTRLAELAGTAIAAVDRHGAGRTVAGGDQQPTGGYRKVWPAYRGDLSLGAACTGSGTVTLRVQGLANRAAGQPADVELTRVTVACGTTPTVQYGSFVAHPSVQLAVEVVDPDLGPERRSAFGYRLFTDADAAVAVTDEASKPQTMIGDAPRPSVEAIRPGVTTPRTWRPLGAVNMLRIACAGNGSVKVEMRFSEATGNYDATMTDRTNTYDVLCAARPERYEYVVGGLQAKTAGVSLTYQGNGRAPAEVAYDIVVGK